MDLEEDVSEEMGRSEPRTVSDRYTDPTPGPHIGDVVTRRVPLFPGTGLGVVGCSVGTNSFPKHLTFVDAL